MTTAHAVTRRRRSSPRNHELAELARDHAPQRHRPVWHSVDAAQAMQARMHLLEELRAEVAQEFEAEQ